MSKMASFLLEELKVKVEILFRSLEQLEQLLQHLSRMRNHD